MLYRAKGTPGYGLGSLGRWAEVGRPGGAFSKGEPSSAHDLEHLLPVNKVKMSLMVSLVSFTGHRAAGY
jgi:hypothetical protein